MRHFLKKKKRQDAWVTPEVVTHTHINIHIQKYNIKMAWRHSSVSKHLPCKCENLSSNSQNLWKASMVVHVYNRSSPNVKWEAEAGEPLKAQQAGSLVYSLRTTETLSQMWKLETDTQGSPTSTSIVGHVLTFKYGNIAHTYTQHYIYI